jgi:hypothetical protein
MDENLELSDLRLLRLEWTSRIHCLMFEMIECSSVVAE